ncbi:hypothetical protein ANCDUO_00393 [Ancylostoma duodenale]|uniref:Uncharacterized protein n=1 Tax=Ancylostoma duodenale TaxID=51022 RepID=A0A0C2HHZ6_9BILA|nr:hypothetical protein ANCDUO_00393 [Ancylostoma duodenale]
MRQETYLKLLAEEVLAVFKTGYADLFDLCPIIQLQLIHAQEWYVLKEHNVTPTPESVDHSVPYPTLQLHRIHVNVSLVHKEQHVIQIQEFVARSGHFLQLPQIRVIGWSAHRELSVIEIQGYVDHSDHCQMPQWVNARELFVRRELNATRTQVYVALFDLRIAPQHHVLPTPTTAIVLHPVHLHVRKPPPAAVLHVFPLVFAIADIHRPAQLTQPAFYPLNVVYTK